MSAPSGIDGLYVHVPFCDGKCSYCAFYSIPYARERVLEWIQAVGCEAARLAGETGGITPQTVYFGGGTPSLLPAAEFQDLARRLREGLIAPEWDPFRAVEWTVEANPGALTEDWIRRGMALGVNRLSLGVQALQDATLARLGRRHRVADVERAIRMIRRTGLPNWGVDLMACVPGVARHEWRETLRRAVAWDPKHISVYALTPEEGVALSADIQRGKVRLQDGEQQLEMLAMAGEVLCAAGFERYEISNYAKPGFACRHNLSCWQGGNYIGLGCAAASRVGLKRWRNVPDLDRYTRAAGKGGLPEQEVDWLTPETDAVERLVFGLRMTAGVSLERIGRETGCSPVRIACWTEALTRMEREGLVEGRASHWRLTRRGMDLADHVAVELMP